MANTITEAMANAVSKVSKKAKAIKPEPEETPITLAKTWREALENVLTTVPTSARKLLTQATERVVKSVHARVQNDLELGQLGREVQGAISKESFGRWTYEVVQRIGLSKSALYNYMDRFDTMSATLPFVPAREALIGVTACKGFFTREDGEAKLQGSILAALKAFPTPTSGTYEDCLDWAHEVQVKIEQLAPAPASKLATQYKQCKNLFERVIKKNHKYAVEIVLFMYRTIYATSVPLAHEVEEGIQKINLEFESLSKGTVKQESARAHERAIA
jgi:hypothetical protein